MWTDSEKNEAQEVAKQVWLFLSVMGLDYLYLYLYLGHLSRGRWGAAGACSEVQLASLRAIGETESAKSRTSYNPDEDCRALPLNFRELEPGLPKAEDIGRLDVLEYVGSDLQELMTRPELFLLPEMEWPPSSPKAKVNVAKVADWWFVAAKLVDRGLLKPISPERIFQARGQRVTNGLFAVSRCLIRRPARSLIGTPGRLQKQMRGRYERHSIPTSVNEANQRQVLVTRMGAESDGVIGRAASNRAKNVQLYSLTLWLATWESPLGNQLLVLLGRWVRALEFRRPLFGAFNAVWDLGASGRAASPRGCLDELVHEGAGVRAAVGLAEGAEAFLNSLGSPETWSHHIAGYSGQCVVEVPRAPAGATEVGPRVLLVSLVDGIGGAAVSLLRAGFLIRGYMSSEVGKGARRALRTRWLGLIELGPVEAVAEKQLE
ncbi:unnamed protein product, partial [Prorocentrum cordatum]